MDLYRRNSQSSLSLPPRESIYALNQKSVISPTPSTNSLRCGHNTYHDYVVGDVKDRQKYTEKPLSNCGGKPIPTHVLELALGSGDSEHSVFRCTRDLSADDLASTASSWSGVPTLYSPPCRSDFTNSRRSSQYAPISHQADQERAGVLEKALQDPKLQTHWKLQREEMERAVIFEIKQRKVLRKQQVEAESLLRAKHATLRDDMILEVIRTKIVSFDYELLLINSYFMQHIIALEQLEERQVMVEHDLRAAQDEETQRVATALKHIEAYCNGPAKQSENDTKLVAYIVTDEDRETLKRQRMIQAGLARKHQSAINVLRAKQERAVNDRTEKQRAQREALESTFDAEDEALRNELNGNSRRLENLLSERRRRLLHRWELKGEMWMMGFEEDSGARVATNVWSLDWPDSKTIGSGEILRESRLDELLYP